MNRVSFFDLDHTLLSVDTDVTWKEFLVEEGIAPTDALERAQRFFDQYMAGKLDREAFLKFQLEEFVGKTPEEMRILTEKHCETKVRPALRKDALAVLNDRLNSDRIVALLTAAELPIVEPIAEMLGVEHICTHELEMKDGKFKGEIVLPFCGSEGKIFYGEAFCKQHNTTLKECEYFGDSLSDQYILDAVGTPVAVNPGEALQKIVKEKGWQVVSWK